MLRVFFHGFSNARYRPLGDSSAAEISGLPKISSRSISGGGPPAACWCCGRAANVAAAKMKHRRALKSFVITTIPFYAADNTRLPRIFAEIVDSEDVSCPVL